jgi:hypothetical protein
MSIRLPLPALALIALIGPATPAARAQAGSPALH